MTQLNILLLIQLLINLIPKETIKFVHIKIHRGRIISVSLLFYEYLMDLFKLYLINIPSKPMVLFSLKILIHPFLIYQAHNSLAFIPFVFLLIYSIIENKI